MKIENHILNILQLYEFAMAIGKSLDYKENCDALLKLILKRKSLNATWILKEEKNKLISTYSLPMGKEVKTDFDDKIKQLLESEYQYKLLDAEGVPPAITPIKIETGQLAVFNLKAQGYLFFYTQKHNFTEDQLSQLQPVIDKFYNSLLACRSFEEQKTLLQNLKVQNQELSDYAHMVSHDLKSPLRSIDALSYFLKEDFENELGEQGRQQIDTIRTNVEKMDALINGILDYSTIGKHQTEFYDVNLDQLVKDIINLIDVPEHCDIKVSELPVIYGDKYRLQQLFQNLISNAIKYNDKTNPQIEIGASQEDGYHKFYVSDNGIGIEKAYHDRIFETFKKLQNDGSSTGIGLSVVKKIVETYQGRIWVNSEPGEGTTFYFTLKDKH